MKNPQAKLVDGGCEDVVKMNVTDCYGCISITVCLEENPSAALLQPEEVEQLKHSLICNRCCE